MIQVKVGDKLNWTENSILASDNPYTVLYTDEKGALLRDGENYTVWESSENIETDYTVVSNS